MVSASPNVSRAMNARDWGLLLTLSLLWGGSFFFVGVAVHELPPLTIVALRVGLAAPVLWLAIRALGVPVPRDPKIWAAFLVMGVLNNVIPFSLIVWGQTQIASGLALILNATTPLFTVVVAGVLLTDERLSARKVGGVVVGFVGVVVLMGGDALGLAGGTPVLAQLAILGASLSYAFAGTFGRRFARLGVAPMVTAAGQVTGSSLVLVPLALVVDQPWTLPMPSAAVVASVVALAVVSTALAYGLYFRILGTAGATNLLLVTFLIPVTANLLGILVLGETLGVEHVLGMALIGLGLAVMDGRPGRWLSGALGRKEAGA